MMRRSPIGLVKAPVWVLLIALAAAGGCSEQPATLERRGDRPSAEEINQRLREMQRVRLTDGSYFEVVDDGTGAESLEHLVQLECVDVVTAGAESGSHLASCTIDNFGSPSTCADEVCSSQLLLCAAGLLLDVAETPVTFELGATEIPPQRRATNAAIRERAATYAREAGLIAGNALRHAKGLPGADGTCSEPKLTEDVGKESMDTGTAFAETLGQACQIAQSATDDAAADTLAVAETLPATMGSYTVGHWAQWFGASLSYTHMAGLYVDLEVPLDEFDASDPPCDASGADTDNIVSNTAVDLVRYTAMHPATLGDLSISPEALWTGTGLLPDGGVGGGMRDRLAERSGDPTTWSTMPLSQFYTVSGLSGGELNIARRRVAEAAQATSPAPTATFALPLIDGGVPYYAATSRPLLSRNQGLAARLATGVVGSGMHDRVTSESSNGLRPTRQYARASQAAFIDWVATVSSELVHEFGATHDLSALMAPTAATLHDLREGRVTVWYNNDTGSESLNAAFSIFVDSSASDLIVVSGTADESCATSGNVDGEDCTFAALTQQNPDTVSAGPEYGYADYLYFEIHEFPADTLYLLVRRDGTLTSGAGDYELLQAFDIDWVAAEGLWQAATYPLVPAITNQAQQALISNVDSCDQNENSCAGLPRNVRIPLENQLSEDGDAYESSWRHYLQLARDAALRADQLGQEWIDVGYGIDERTEDAWAEVEDECGDVGDIRNDTELFASPGAACTDDGDCVSDRGERCVNQVCLVTPTGHVGALLDDDPRAARTAECLGLDGAAYVPFATLGSKPLCMWRDSNDVYCGDFTGAPSCPFEMSDDPAVPSNPCATGPHGTTVTLPTGLSFVEVTDTLDISHDEYRGQPPAGDIYETCNAIRDGWFADGLDDRVIARQIRGRFTTDELRQIATRLGWVAEPMNLSHLTLDRSPWVPRGLARAAGTGLIEDGLDGGAAIPAAPMGTDLGAWPCGGVPVNVDCTGHRANSLFCQSVVCDATSNEGNGWAGHQNRARINDRMARAVLALKIATDAPMANMRSPYWSDHSSSNYYIGPTSDSERLASVLLGDGTTAQTVSRYSHILQGSTCNNDYCSGTRQFYGDAYCFSNCNGETCPPIWSTVLSDGTWEHRKNAGCIAAGAASSDQIFIAFDPRRYDGISPVSGWSGTASQPISLSMWGGIIGNLDASNGGRSTVRGRMANLVYNVMMRRGESPDNVVLSREVDEGNLDQLTLWWSHNDENEVATAGNWSQSPRSGDQDFVRGLTGGNFLDGFELACELMRSGATVCDPSAPPPEASSVRDLPAVRSHFRCVASAIEDTLDRAVIANVPRAALRGVSPGVGGSGFRLEQGNYGESVVRYAAALEDLRANLPEVARELRGIDRDIEEVELLMQQMEISEQQSILSVVSRSASASAGCASAIGGAISEDTSNVVAAVATCADAAAQIAIAIYSADLESQSQGLGLQSRILELNQRFDDRMGRMATIARTLRQAVADLEAASVELSNRRSSANRALARATLADADGGTLLRTNTVLRRRYNTARTRYFRAFENAQRLAYLARIAIEQQVGMDLNSIQTDMSLVPRPDSWADSVCQATGLDYSRIRDARDPAYEDYADQYIGDYVDLLERFVESYRIDFPFQDGRDTVVLSAREDIAHSRVTCDVPVGNLLLGSGDLDADTTLGPAGEVLSAWEVRGCLDPDPADPVPEPCVSRSRTTSLAEEGPFPDWHGQFDQRTVFDVTFNPDDGDPGNGTRYTEDTTVTQRTWLTAGRYRLSWYALGSGLSTTLVATDSAGVAFSKSPTASIVSSAVVVSPWQRHVFLFDVLSDQEAHISWVPLNPTSTSPQTYTVAAPMLETVASRRGSAAAITSMSVTADFPPAEYAETNLLGERALPSCPDTTGSEYRASHWRRRCQELCPSGFDSGTCDGGSSYCYYETEFNIDPQALARGGLFREPGFARGNYNYRIDRIGLNFVGTASRDCRDSRAPDTCYSNGWIPYSLLHRGRTVVIDHYGSTDYVAPINPGRMESVRGLAAERYVTNPLSSADRSLMDDYMNRQFRGRPLPGTYVLRVWDAPGVNFNGIEDVQILLDYSYWTRQE